MHISSVADPLAQTVKSVSVVEWARDGNQTIAWLVDKAQKGELSINTDTLAWTAQPYCGHVKGDANVHLSLWTEQNRKRFYESLPWLLRHNAPRFPFLWPEKVGNPKKKQKLSGRCIYNPRDPDIVREKHRCVWHSRGVINKAEPPHPEIRDFMRCPVNLTVY